MKNRSELPQIYYDFSNMVKTQFSQAIKILRADNAQEYKEMQFLRFLRQNGTLPQYSCPGTSQQNGHVECKHRHLLDTVRALLISSSCPERFWGEVALTTAYTINRVPSPIINNQSPYERLYGTPPNCSTSMFLGVLVSFYFNPMNVPNWNLDLVFVAS